MSSNVINTYDTKVIGRFAGVPVERLNASIYKSLERKQKRGVTVSAMDHFIVERMRFYHPFWIVTMTVTSERGLFPPKIEPVRAFVDAVSGYRGKIKSKLELEEQNLGNVPVAKAIITSERALRPYLKDLQNYWNRQYVGDRPSYEHISFDLAYLPMWFVSLRIDGEHKTVILNGDNGEPEDYLAAQWETDHWHRF